MRWRVLFVQDKLAPFLLEKTRPRRHGRAWAAGWTADCEARQRRGEARVAGLPRWFTHRGPMQDLAGLRKRLKPGVQARFSRWIPSLALSVV